MVNKIICAAAFLCVSSALAQQGSLAKASKGAIIEALFILKNKYNFIDTNLCKLKKLCRESNLKNLQLSQKKDKILAKLDQDKKYLNRLNQKLLRTNAALKRKFYALEAIENDKAYLAKLNFEQNYNIYFYEINLKYCRYFEKAIKKLKSMIDNYIDRNDVMKQEIRDAIGIADLLYELVKNNIEFIEIAYNQQIKELELFENQNKALFINDQEKQKDIPATLENYVKKEKTYVSNALSKLKKDIELSGKRREDLKNNIKTVAQKLFSLDSSLKFDGLEDIIQKIEKLPFEKSNMVS